MFADNSSHHFLPPPHPGEIWELDLAWDSGFLSKNRYVTIVREPQPEYPTILSAMLLSAETEYLSDVDILIPPAISGLDRDLLAETWNVRSFSTSLLLRRVGKRLSRQIYDLLLSIGDRQDQRSSGFLGQEITSSSNLEFHQREKIWFYSLNFSAILDVANLMEQTIAVERDFIDLVRIRTCLSQWFQQIIESEWQELNNVDRRMAIATRSEIADDDIIETIEQINSIDDEVRRRQLIKKLGYLGKGRHDAIQTLIQSIGSTQDEETLWVAVDSLRQIDPEHPHGGISRSKLIDLGTTVNFVVHIVPRFYHQTNHQSPERFGILLQVYPNPGSDGYLPANLKLIVRDEIGNDLTAVVARSIDRCIQLKLSGKQRELFSVCLDLNGIDSISDFII